AGFQSVLNSRMIGIAMIRAKGKRGGVNPTDRSEDWAKIRHDLYSFALCNFREIKKLYFHDQETRINNNRSNDLWSPLLAIARGVFKDHPEEFFKFKAFAGNQIIKTSKNSLEDEVIALLYSLKDTVDGDGEYSIKDIREGMESYLEPDQLKELKSSWIGYKIIGFQLSHGKIKRAKGSCHILKKSEVEDILDRYKYELDLIRD
ncbi:MAG: hypothetical protein KAR20_14055, partial [Candidatus Heimdallarchaeota archaeon]|nr:hypothetical protein [Candidatus Heimdallarchaeota archaeon]